MPHEHLRKIEDGWYKWDGAKDESKKPEPRFIDFAEQWFPDWDAMPDYDGEVIVEKRFGLWDVSVNIGDEVRMHALNHTTGETKEAFAGFGDKPECSELVALAHSLS